MDKQIISLMTLIKEVEKDYEKENITSEKRDELQCQYRQRINERLEEQYESEG